MDNSKSLKQLLTDSSIHTSRSNLTKPPISPTGKISFQLIEPKLNNSGKINGRQLEQLAKRIQLFINELQDGQLFLKQSTKSQRQEWMLDKKEQLKQIANQFEKVSVGASQSQISASQNLISNASALIEQLSNEDVSTDELKKISDRQQVLRELQKDTIGITNDSNLSQHNISSRLDDLRFKEDRLDQDFKKLLTRYNKSKVLIDNIADTKNAPQQQSYFQPPKHLQHSITQDRLQSRGILKNRSENQFITNSERVVKNKEVSWNNGNITEGKDKPTVYQSIQKLKDTITQRDSVDKEKRLKQNTAIKDLKMALKEYIKKCQELEFTLTQKDEIIQKMEVELKTNQDNILENMERIKEIKEKENQWNQLKIQYQQQIQELQEKAQRKKKKSKNYKILFQDCDKQAQETKEAYKSEVQSLNSQINEWEQQFKQIEARQSDMQNLINQLKEDNRVKQTQIQQLMEKNEKLDQELDQTSGQLQAESNKNQEFSSDNQILEKKCEELRELLNQQEDKLQMKIAKYEDEIKTYKEQKIFKVKEKKDKIKTQKLIIQEQNDRIQKQDNEFIQLIQQLENYKNQCQGLECDLTRLNQANITLSNQVADNKDTIARMMSDLDKEQNIINNQETKIKETEKCNIELQKQLTEIKNDLAQTLEENSQLKEVVARTEAANDCMQKQQNEELTEIESKVETLLRENQCLKQENGDLKVQVSSFKKAVASQEEQQNIMKEKYQKAKTNNKNLKSQLENVGNKVRDFMQEKAFDINLTEKQKITDSVAKNKIRVLDEIQSMIKKHKQTQQQVFKDD